MKISVDTRDFRTLESHLKTFKASAHPFATKAMLNKTAFEAQDIARKRLRFGFVLRNKHAIQSIRVNPTKTLRVNQQAAVIGSTADYMETQEFGGTNVKKGRHGVVLPTSFSAGQSEKSRPRFKLARPSNKLRRLRLSRGSTRPTGQPKDRKQAFLFKVQDAISSGGRVFFHKGQRGRATGIYRVKGGRKGFKRGWPKGARVKLLHRIEHTAYTIPRKPWLGPTVDVARKRMPRLYTDALRFQLKRHNLFKG